MIEITVWILEVVDAKIIFTFRDSSTVEQEAVNFKVLGSNPSRGAAKRSQSFTRLFL